MSVKRWLSIVIPAGLLFGLALGWLSAGAQEMSAPCQSGQTKRVGNALYLCLHHVDMTWTSTGQSTPWPHFKASPNGWLPSCPAGTALIRHYPAPDCFWGTAPLNQKPTQGDMECVDTAQATKLPACPKE